MRKIALLSILILIITVVHGQDKKRVKRLFKDAEEHLLYEEFDMALPLYQELIDIGWDNANINFSIGICYLNNKNQYDQAIPYLVKAVEDISLNYREGNYKEESAPEEAWFYLAKAYRLTEKYDKSIEAYKKYKSYLGVGDVYYHDFVDLQIRTCNTAQQMMGNPVNFVAEKVPFTVKGENYFPAIAGDEQSAIFTAFQEVRDDFGDSFFLEVLYHTTKDGPTWKKPRDITYDINSDGYFSSAYLSYSGDFLLLYRDDYGNGNIYYSELEGRTWTRYDKMDKEISSRDNETHASLSKDGNTLFFVSDRPGGFGGKDIYKSVKDDRGNWGPAINLGDVINTPFEEETAFLAEDGKTLYFASEAHNSMGGYDIFKSVMDAGGSWSEPQNLGYPINSAADDIFYLPIGEGTAAYMSRFDEETGERKIFRIEYPQVERIVEVEPEEAETSDDLDTGRDLAESETTTTETGTSTKQPEVKTVVVPAEYELQGNLKLQDKHDLDPSFYIHVAKPDGEVVAALSPNVNTGEFKTMLKPGSYKIKAYGEGYEPAEKMIYISEDQQNPEVLTFLEMVPKEVSSGEFFVIKSILFDYNSTQLDREAKIEIEKLATLMEKNPSLYVQVVGFADALGTDEYNKRLSLKRARAVVEYINNRGIQENRFVTKGMGEEKFIAINKNPDGSDNPEGRRLNRRVEIKIIKSNNENITTQNIYVPDELRYKDQLTYTILLSEEDKPLAPSYFSKSGETIKNVWMFQTSRGYLYTVGRFNHRGEALELMNRVVDAGFPNAQVISSIEYNQLVQKSSHFFKSKMKDDNTIAYTIQLYALKKPTEILNFKGLKEVDMIKGNDGYYRYIWGEFIGKTSARQALNEVIDKGFVDAFIVDMNKFRN